MNAAPVICLTDVCAVREVTLTTCLSWLHASERQRLDRFVRPARRLQFLAGRVLARQMLGALLERAPQTIVLVDRPGAAPVLALPGCEQVGFSISHSGPWIACAVDGGGKVGLDIERIDPTRDIAALAAQAFDPDQCAWLAARAPQDRVRDFYTIWCRAEARCKLGVEAGATFDVAHSDLAIALCAAGADVGTPTLSIVEIEV